MYCIYVCVSVCLHRYIGGIFSLRSQLNYRKNNIPGYPVPNLFFSKGF